MVDAMLANRIARVKVDGTALTRGNDSSPRFRWKYAACWPECKLAQVFCCHFGGRRFSNDVALRES